VLGLVNSKAAVDDRTQNEHGLHDQADCDEVEIQVGIVDEVLDW
jgi:hypothetical protein